MIMICLGIACSMDTPHPPSHLVGRGWRVKNPLAPEHNVSYTNFMNTPQDIGARIRVARRERGLTQDELADRVGVSRSAVAQWETGRTGQVTGTLSRIARVLEGKLEYILYGSET